ncbi:M48 family metalloprotease [Azospirillum picis]|uniref:Zn-dependent protease with chaperone function n=1 Tax=Azospirillum picis TaxID=488438 RepID=A0ABU0MLZ5_9PROT|nr:M48 family metalloprotease [Azospirillum picis]MBP2300524.1 Zn-dependent protease with chaperone function [Azospirillum picis]MDQ0534493.1 Zn-dependent protease with chaperone function [Azospirillum picis]
MAFTIASGGAAGLRRRILRLPSGLTLVLWLLVLPLALVALGGWQERRGAATLDGYRQAREELPRTLAQLQRIEAENPSAFVTIEGSDGRRFPVSMAVARLRNAIGTLDEGVEVSAIRYPLSWGTMAGGLLAFLAGLGGLVAARIAARRARGSRDATVRSFDRLRRILPFTLAGVLVGLCVSGIAAALFEAASLWFWDHVSTASAKLFGLGVVLAALAAYSAVMAVIAMRRVFGLYTLEPLDVWAVAANREMAPGLWRFVEDLAARHEALVPDTILVGLAGGFFVTEAPVRLPEHEQVLSGRTLHLPAPYLPLIGETEFAAIIGHELSHFSGEDTVYSQRFAPIHAGLWRTLRALGRNTGAGSFVLHPALRLGFHALETFDHSVAQINRLRELEADRRSSMVSGRESIPLALLRTTVLDPVIEDTLDDAFSDPDGSPPDLVAEVVRRAEGGLPDPTGHLETCQPHPTDRHPPTILRITTLGVPLDERILARATRGPTAEDTLLPHRLFSDWTGLCHALTLAFLGEAWQTHRETRQELEAAAAAIPAEHTVLYENGKPMIWAMAVIASLFATFALCTTVFAPVFGLNQDPSKKTIIVVVTAAMAGAALLYAAWIRHRTKAPLMTLTPEGLVSARLREAIAWTDVAGMHVTASQRLALVLALHEEAPLPNRIGFSIYNKVDRRKRTVVLEALGIRGMKADEFQALVGRYLNAAYARRQLGDD